MKKFLLSLRILAVATLILAITQLPQYLFAGFPDGTPSLMDIATYRFLFIFIAINFLFLVLFFVIGKKITDSVTMIAVSITTYVLFILSALFIFHSLFSVTNSRVYSPNSLVSELGCFLLNGNDKLSCYSYLAAQVNDIKICKKSDGRCYDYFAQKNNDPSLCNSQECLSTGANMSSLRNSPNPAFCEAMSEEQEKKLCYARMAESSNNYSLCLKSGEIKDGKEILCKEPLLFPLESSNVSVGSTVTLNGIGFSKIPPGQILTINFLKTIDMVNNVTQSANLELPTRSDNVLVFTLPSSICLYPVQGCKPSDPSSYFMKITPGEYSVSVAITPTGLSYGLYSARSNSLKLIVK